MRNRFHIDAPLTPGAIFALDAEEQHHAHVLRVREGEEVEVFDGRGNGYSAVWEGGAVRILAVADGRETRVALHLAMSIIQLDKFELVLQKATELGAASIIPLVTDRAEVRPERYRGKIDRWRRIVFEAVKQSGRTRIPEIEEPVLFEAAVQHDGLRIVFDADAEPSEFVPGSAAVLFIGPEGGWSAREIELARASGCRFSRLGPRRLRAETAAIVALAMAAARSGELW